MIFKNQTFYSARKLFCMPPCCRKCANTYLPEVQRYDSTMQLIWPHWYLETFFPVSPRNRFISSGLEPVFTHTEKLCIAS